MRAMRGAYPNNSELGGQVGARGSGAPRRPVNVVITGLAALRSVAPRRRSHGASGLGAQRPSQTWNCRGTTGLPMSAKPGA